MKRMHIHVGVSDLDRSIGFYSSLFGAGPTVRHPDYAKWMLEEPRVNFAISTHAARGIEHVGIEVESDADLADVGTRLHGAGEPVMPEASTTCCYAHSSKNWTRDPDGVIWETFLTRGQATSYGARPADAVVGTTPAGAEEVRTSTACCG
ncbi:MAG: ArsI/CadI family heavy metal resistance metalloenzyme [Thermaurantiacus sp.]